MNKPERLELRGVPKNVEVVHEGGTIILRTIVDAAAVRAACREIRKHAPKPKKGESIVRELHALRDRGAR